MYKYEIIKEEKKQLLLFFLQPWNKSNQKRRKQKQILSRLLGNLHPEKERVYELSNLMIVIIETQSTPINVLFLSLSRFVLAFRLKIIDLLKGLLKPEFSCVCWKNEENKHFQTLDELFSHHKFISLKCMNCVSDISNLIFPNSF